MKSTYTINHLRFKIIYISYYPTVNIWTTKIIKKGTKLSLIRIEL